VVNPLRPVVVFHGNSELEAQIARDALTAATIPVLHLPSVSTGIFGTPSTVRVAVPEEFAEQAVQVIQQAGLMATMSKVPGEMAAIGEAIREKVIPVAGGPARLPEKSWLRRVLIFLAVLILFLVVATIYRN
jgi:hypothetical protein